MNDETKEIIFDLLIACKAMQTFCVFVDSNLRPEQGHGFKQAWDFLTNTIYKTENFIVKETCSKYHGNRINSIK